MVEAALSAPLRPILALRNMVALGFQQIDLVQVGLLAHLHDSDTKVPEHGRGAAVLLARFPVARLVHEGLPFHGADTQAASFKHKNNTLRLYSQQLKTIFGRLNNYIRFYL